MRILHIISFLLITLCLLAQDSADDQFYLDGQVYGGLPIQLSVNTVDGINGYSKYGSQGELEYKLEGEVTSDGYMLYEFDEDHILSGIIEITNDKQQGVWNSVNFQTNIPISFFNRSESTTYDFARHQSYVAVSYPKEDEAFDEKFGAKIRHVVRDLAEEYGAYEVKNGVNSPGNRFSHRTISVDKRSLDSDELISGHLTFYNNQSNKVETLTYSYDRSKKEMLTLNKIFKKNFNYSFFLKQYIAQKKEKMEPLLSPLESTWFKATSFHHYELTDSGLKFFSDYNTIFGRKSFTIPYHEIASSIGQKSIANYIKKRK